jgi:hypothetical protein
VTVDNEPAIDGILGPGSIRSSIVPGPYDKNLKSNWSGTEVIYVSGEGYKVIIDMGSYTYALDLPEDYTAEQVSNYTGGKTNETDKANEAGITIITQDQYNSGALNNDTLIYVPSSILDVGGDAFEIANGFLDAVEQNRGRVTATLLADDEYTNLLGAEYLASGGDMKTAIDNFAKTDKYGEILSRLGVTQAEIDAERKEFVDPLGYAQNVSAYIDLYQATALSTYGSELPSDVVNYLAEQTAKGFYTQTAALNQLNAIFDDYSPYKIDTGVIGVLEGETIARSADKQDVVQDLLDTYLPKHLHGSFNIAEEAGKLRNIANYRTTLESKLKKTRFQFYPNYDENIAWNTIISSKLQSALDVTGVQLKEDDPLINQLVSLNDYAKEQELLRTTGLERGYQKTRDDLNKAMISTFGSGIVRSTAYVG